MRIRAVGKLLFVLLLLGLAVAGWTLFPSLSARLPDDFQKLSGPERVARARATSEAKIRERFQSAGVVYPPREIFLRAFKKEKVLELWARDDDAAFHHIATWDVLAASGQPGPKRREGDKQVPEGFYEIDRLNPESRFHLSLRLNYPNASDRVRSDAQKPGSEIFIHGKNVSIGCLALGDAVIEELFVLALEVREGSGLPIHVHVFPVRMSGAKWEEFSRAEIARNPVLEPFWAELHPAYERFEQERKVPAIEVLANGRYELERVPRKGSE